VKQLPHVSVFLVLVIFNIYIIFIAILLHKIFVHHHALFKENLTTKCRSGLNSPLQVDAKG